MIARAGKAYSVFGGVLRSGLELPELHPAASEHEDGWTLAVRSGGPPGSSTFESAAVESLPGGASVELLRSSNGDYRLQYSDTGTFEVTEGGRRIDWYRPSGVREDFARTDILGRVLALAAHSQQLLVLHASAVALDGGVVGFLAPKFYGKSTLACALTDAGARLVTDDALAIRSRGDVQCAPGIPAIRLRSEAASHLRGTWSGETDNSEWRHVDRRDPEEIASDWLPVAALYLLRPRRSEQMTEAVTRERLDETTAAISLIRFAKLGALLRGPLAVDYLDRAAHIAAAVPVYAMHYARDLDRLDEVTTQVASWHRA